VIIFKFLQIDALALVGAFLDQKQKIAAFGSSYESGFLCNPVGAAEGCDLLSGVGMIC
jgi:hypothetical protein